MQMAAPRPVWPPPGNLAEIKALLVGLGTVVGLQEAELTTIVDDALEPKAVESTEMHRAARADAELILNMLRRERLGLGNPDFEGDMTREAQEYFWVD